MSKSSFKFFIVFIAGVVLGSYLPGFFSQPDFASIQNEATGLVKKIEKEAREPFVVSFTLKEHSDTWPGIFVDAKKDLANAENPEELVKAIHDAGFGYGMAYVTNHVESD